MRGWPIVEFSLPSLVGATLFDIGRIKLHAVAAARRSGLPEGMCRLSSVVELIERLFSYSRTLGEPGRPFLKFFLKLLRVSHQPNEIYKDDERTDTSRKENNHITGPSLSQSPTCPFPSQDWSIKSTLVSSCRLLRYKRRFPEYFIPPVSMSSYLLSICYK